MRAIVQDGYGPPDAVLRFREIDQPAVQDDAVLVRVYGASVAGDDWHLVRGLPYAARLASGLVRPRNRVPGREFAGRVEALGNAVRGIRPGDEVFGWCVGALAEYAAVDHHQLVRKPAHLTFEQAAVVPISAVTALQALRDEGRIRPGQNVLILGASGGVGTFAVQIGKALGAHVTGVCSTRNVELVQSIGADHVIDYTREAFTAYDARYDVVVDMVQGRPLADCRRVLRPDGTLVMVGTSALHVGRWRERWFKGTDRWAKALVLSPFVRHRLRPLIHRDCRDDLMTVTEFIEAEKVTPIVTATYPLRKVTEAIQHFKEGHARGKVAITV